MNNKHKIGEKSMRNKVGQIMEHVGEILELEIKDPGCQS
jgi:hypothetical protein